MVEKVCTYPTEHLDTYGMLVSQYEVWKADNWMNLSYQSQVVVGYFKIGRSKGLFPTVI